MVLQLQQSMQQNNTASVESNNNSSVVLNNSISLEQNIPNPFTNSTIINYTLPKTFNKAAIIITDKSGKTLKEINLNGTGKGSITVDVSTLSAGTY